MGWYLLYSGVKVYYIYGIDKYIYIVVLRRGGRFNPFPTRNKGGKEGGTRDKQARTSKQHTRETQGRHKEGRLTSREKG